jgi:membrane protein YdbS with pleckstrin-like domain
MRWSGYAAPGTVESVTHPPTAQLRDPAHRVARRAMGFWAVRAALGWLLVVGIQVVVIVASQGGGSANYAVLGGTVLLATGHIVVMPPWRYRVHRWEATDEAVYTQSGWFNQERRVAPVSRIQTVDTERGPLAQLFGLADVTVTTASAAGPLKIHGLRLDTAVALVEELTVRTSSAPGDAT